LSILLAACLSQTTDATITTETSKTDITKTPLKIESTPTNTIEPSKTHTHTPTITPTLTETPVPMLEGLSIPVPDPRITNPELFDLTRPDAQIPQFVNAMGMLGYELDFNLVIDNIVYKEKKSLNNKIVILGSSKSKLKTEGVDEGLTDEYPLLIWDDDHGWRQLSLKEFSDYGDFNAGAQLTRHKTKTDSQYRETFLKHYSLGMAEVDFYPYKESERQTLPELKYLDTVANFTSDKVPLQVHHILKDDDKWYPKWLLENNYSQEELTQLLKQHIQTVMEKYPGIVTEWSVVNEAIGGDGKQGYTSNPWYRGLGPEYITIAFKTAREINPEATLLYNDFGLEADPQKASQVFQIVSDLAEQKLVDGVGMQLRIQNINRVPSKQQVIDTMQKFASLGVDIYVTELIVNMSDYYGSPEDKAVKHAEIYKTMLEACLESGVCHSFTTFGFSDIVSQYGDDKSPEALEAWALPFDSDFNPKPAYYEMLKVMSDHFLITP